MALSSFNANPKGVTFVPPSTLPKDPGRMSFEARIMSYIVYFVLRFAFLCARASTSLTKSLMIEFEKMLKMGKSSSELSASKVMLASSVGILTGRYLGMLAGGWTLCVGVELVMVVIYLNLLVWSWRR